MRIYYKVTGDWKRTEKWLKKIKNPSIEQQLASYGYQGIRALASATPVDSGLTASSWDFEVVSNRGLYELHFYNTNTATGVPVAILIQYGHGTGTGGYVVGRDYINPAIQPIFDEIADKVWEEVRNG